VTYTLEEIDDIWTLLKDGEVLCRVISKPDGEALLEEFKSSGSGALRDRLLSAVNDAIEETFDVPL
jgi:hypothetical protein